MTIYTKNAPIPEGHLYGFVNGLATHGLDPAFKDNIEPCIIFMAQSIPSRAWHFQIMCESGAQWAHIPLHMVYWHEPEQDKTHELSALQCWDCHGHTYSVVRPNYLRDMACDVKLGSDILVPAAYWFTADHIDNGWSDYPPEHKCYHFLLLEDGSGQIAAMPNNRILWKDYSFTKSKKLDYKTAAATTWHAEGVSYNPHETAFVKDAK